MVRNPYAIVESIYRRRKQQLVPPDANILDLVAIHVANCFRWQRANVECYSHVGTFFSYETLCAHPEQVEQQIRTLVPVLEDLTLRQTLAVKGIYEEPLRDMNADHIARLTDEQIARINMVFVQHEETLAYFNYALFAP